MESSVCSARRRRCSEKSRTSTAVAQTSRLTERKAERAIAADVGEGAKCASRQGEGVEPVVSGAVDEKNFQPTSSGRRMPSPSSELGRSASGLAGESHQSRRSTALQNYHQLGD
eukprot:scaffold8214_cov248-Pinguiococcus_pyrenoidosus.AAC.1